MFLFTSLALSNPIPDAPAQEWQRTLEATGSPPPRASSRSAGASPSSGSPRDGANGSANGGGADGLVRFLASLFDGQGSDDGGGGSPKASPKAPAGSNLAAERRGGSGSAASAGNGGAAAGDAAGGGGSHNSNLILSGPDGTGLSVTLQLSLLQQAAAAPLAPLGSAPPPQQHHQQQQRDMQAELRLGACQLPLAPHMLPRLAALHHSLAALHGAPAPAAASHAHSQPQANGAGAATAGRAAAGAAAAALCAAAPAAAAEEGHLGGEEEEDDQWAQRSFVDGLFFPDCKHLVADTLGSTPLPPALATAPPHHPPAPLRQRWRLAASAPELSVKLLYPDAVARISGTSSLINSRRSASGSGAGSAPSFTPSHGQQISASGASGTGASSAARNGGSSGAALPAAADVEAVQCACAAGAGVGGDSGLVVAFGGVRAALALSGGAETSFELAADELQVRMRGFSRRLAD